MDRLERVSLILHVIERLNKKSYRSGETSVQKLLYFIQEMLDIDFNYQYELYNYGPFSFNLNEDIDFMENAHVIYKEPDPSGFGFMLIPNKEIEFVQNVLKSKSRYEGKIDQLLDEFSIMPAKNLALLATFIFVLENEKPKTEEEAIEIVKKIKPMHNIFEYPNMLKKAKEMLNDNYF